VASQQDDRGHPGDGPEIRIDGYSLVGDVKISDRPPA
jgi:hypothetical protein